MQQTDSAVDLFETGLSILFNEPEVNCGSAGESITVHFDGHPAIALTLPDTKAGDVFLFAHHIWKSSVLLSKLLLELDISGCVLELGAGAGLVSIVCCRKGAECTASDYPADEILNVLKLNLERNCPGKQYSVWGHAWGQPIDTLHIGRYQLIVMADTLWVSNQHGNLLSDIKKLLATDGRLVGACGMHTGQDVVESFLAKAVLHGLKSTKIGYFCVPIGSGLCENRKWETVRSICHLDVSERGRHLMAFEITHLRNPVAID